MPSKMAPVAACRSSLGPSPSKSGIIQVPELRARQEFVQRLMSLPCQPENLVHGPRAVGVDDLLYLQKSGLRTQANVVVDLQLVKPMQFRRLHRRRARMGRHILQ